MKLVSTLVASACLAAGISTAGIADEFGWARRWIGEPDWARQKLAEVRTGFTIAPVPLYLKGLDPAKVGLGSYFVNALGGCNDCHTNPSYAVGGNPFLGEPKQVNAAKYLAGGQAFGPLVKSLNITPDSQDRPAGLTLAQFVHVLRTGENPYRPGTLLQVMPWPVYQNMTDSDLTAIYTYLQAIPSLPNNY